jgi:hypothetical protein
LRLWFSGRIEQGEPLRVVFRRGTEIVQLLNLRRASNQPVEEEIESSEEIQVRYVRNGYFIHIILANFSNRIPKSSFWKRRAGK